MGKFLIKRTKSNNYVFNLKSTNGQVISTSQTYKSLSGCMNSIASIQKNAPFALLEDQTIDGFETMKHPKFEIHTDKAGETRFRLKATNGQIIATSEGYAKKALEAADARRAASNKRIPIWWKLEISPIHHMRSIIMVRKKNTNVAGSTLINQRIMKNCPDEHRAGKTFDSSGQCAFCRCEHRFKLCFFKYFSAHKRALLSY